MSAAMPGTDGATRERVLRIALPVLALGLAVVAWDLVVRLAALPPYVLPGPGLVVRTLFDNAGVLFGSLGVTLVTTAEALALAVVGGVGLAVLFNQARAFEYAFYPFAVILQVTPVIAVAPLLLIYLPQPLAVLACAWIVAFFPVLANTTLGLQSVDRNLVDLFRLYGASRWQTLCVLKLPAALPADAGRHPHRRRAGADRRRGRGNRRRFCRRRLGTGVPHRGSWLPARYSPHVRGAAVVVAGWYRHLFPAHRAELPRPAALA
jgi:ABC-type sugar transport system permease subunit